MQDARRWFDPRGKPLAASRHTVRGFRVTVMNTREDIDTASVIERLGTALVLIDRHTPHYGRHLRRDFAGILVQR